MDPDQMVAVALELLAKKFSLWAPPWKSHAQKGSTDLSLAIRVDGKPKFRAVGRRKGDKGYLRHTRTMAWASSIGTPNPETGSCRAAPAIGIVLRVLLG